MGRFYSVTLPETAITAAADLFEIVVATDKPVRVWGFTIGQDTDLGDTNEEELQLILKRGITPGSGGSAITPTPMRANDTAAAATCTNRTTAHTGGTILWTLPWNIRTTGELWFTPEAAPECGADDDPLVLHMTAPGDSITVTGSLLFEELA